MTSPPKNRAPATGAGPMTGGSESQLCFNVLLPIRQDRIAPGVKAPPTAPERASIAGFDWARVSRLADARLGVFPDPRAQERDWSVAFCLPGKRRIFLQCFGTGAVGIVHTPTNRELRDADRVPISPYAAEEWPPVPARWPDNDRVAVLAEAEEMR